MNFNDRFKFALRNINNSKSRSFLTVVIVFVVTLLILVIGLSCISIAENSSAMAKQYFTAQGSSYNISAQWSNDNTKQSFINAEEFAKIRDIFKAKNTCDTLYGDTYIDLFVATNSGNTGWGQDGVRFNSVKGYDYEFGFCNDSDDFLVEGRAWNKTDANTNGILISRSMLKSINEQQSVFYTVGDILPCKTVSYSSGMGGNNDILEKSIDLRIIGVFDTSSLPDNDYEFKNLSVILDLSFLFANVERMQINQLRATYIAPNIAYDFNAIHSSIKATVKDINAVLEPNIGESAKTPRANNTLVDELKFTMILNAVIIGLGCILGFIVILLSIGSVANTIMISIDKNRRFTGLMMAMGLKHKNVKSIVKIESCITITLGILLSTILCYALTPIFQSLLSKLFMSLFYVGDFAFVYKFTVPFYYPIAVALVFIGMALLFSRTGLRKLEKMDVISVISEVG